MMIYEEDDDQSNNLDFIKRVVDESGTNALTPDELATYEAYLQAEVREEASEMHYANLAESLPITELNRIATDVIKWTEWDEDSREEWSHKESRGIRAMGVSPNVDGGANFEGACKVVHPLLAEAVVQFHSRSIVELWPSDGPVKAQIMGVADQAAIDQADRVERYLNYLYTTKMPGGFDEEDQLLFRLPLSGSCFKKLYFDPDEKCIVSRFVEPSDFIVPYSAIDLRSAPRFTHRLRYTKNKIKRLQSKGYYLDVPLTSAMNELHDYPEVRTEIEATEGRASVAVQDDQRYTVLEMYVDLEIKGYEDVNEKGKLTGVALPYIVTVLKDENRVLRIQRNWKPDDTEKRKRIFFVHKKLMPGLGFYGYGLYHLIGGMSDAATGALRAMLDAAAFANLQGGFRTRDARIAGDDMVVSPGEWKEVDSTAEELSKAFFPFPYKEPSRWLYELLGYLDQRAQRFAGTTENMVGEANNAAPVGTTLALIEQGSKTFTSIHSRLHRANAEEFKILAELCYEYLPEEGYPYKLPGVDALIMAQDFDERVDIIPVSDPNIISTTQRMAQAQAILDMAQQFPALIDAKVAIRRMFEAMKVKDVDELLIQDTGEPSADDKLKLAQADKLQAEAARAQADKTLKNIQAQYSAMQGAQVAVTVPGTIPVADEMLASGGYRDENGPPLAGNVPQMSIPQAMPEPQTNTSPAFPPKPRSPGLGAAHGIETQINDGSTLTQE